MEREFIALCQKLKPVSKNKKNLTGKSDKQLHKLQTWIRKSLNDILQVYHTVPRWPPLSHENGTLHWQPSLWWGGYLVRRLHWVQQMGFLGCLV